MQGFIADCALQIEGLIDDIDLRGVVSREQLESRSRHLVPKFTQPIVDALAAANLTIVRFICYRPVPAPNPLGSLQGDVESVILVGGSSRVPMVEAAVRHFVGEDKIAKNVNADEAAVMGSPFCHHEALLVTNPLPQVPPYTALESLAGSARRTFVSRTSRPTVSTSRTRPTSTLRVRFTKFKPPTSKS